MRGEGTGWPAGERGGHPFGRTADRSHVGKGFFRRRKGGSRIPAVLAGWIVLVLGFAVLAGATQPLPSSPFPAGPVPPDRGRFATEAVLVETILPSVETDPSHHANDTADDMAIWLHPTDLSKSLVIGDDKEGGLMVWGLDGKEVQYIEGTRYNNVDLRYNFPLAGTFATGESHSNVSLVGVSDEGQRQFDFFKVNPYARLLEPAGEVDISIRPYGGCMYLSVATDTYYFLAANVSGVMEQWAVRDGGDGQVAGDFARTFDVGNITEGCVADDLLGHLYLAEEPVGIWKYGAEPDTGDARTLVDSTDGGNLVADAEGLSIYYAGPDLGYLFASSQGESRVAVYLREGTNDFLGKFEVAANGTIDRVTASDGLDVTNAPLGGLFGAGLFAIHDSVNTGANASNLKFVSYGAIASALGLVIDTLWDPRLVGLGVPPPPLPFDFVVTVDPASGSVEPGGALTAIVTATLLSGDAQEVLFACDGLPAGASCTFTPPSCGPTCDATLSLGTDSSTPHGMYAVNVTATDGSITRSFPFLLTVLESPPPPPFDFLVSVDPAAGSIEPGGELTAIATATLVSGSSQEVTFSCEGLPAGAACTFTPPACSPTCDASMSLATDPTTPPGTFNVNVTAADGTISRTAVFILTVLEPPPPPPFDFLLVADPSSGSVEPGGALSAIVTATLVSGDTHDVDYACDGLPAGTFCTFIPPSCAPTCEATLSLTTDPSTPPGTYPIDVIATDGTITRTTVFVLLVQEPPPPPPFDFILSVDPAAGSILPGEALDVTVTATLISGDTHDVPFSCDALPLGVSCTFTPPSCGPTCNATLALATSPTTPPGTYAINVTATDGAITRTVAFVLTVREPPPPPPPLPPTARFTFDPASPYVDDLVTFDGRSSTSDRGTALQGRWDWEGDGVWDTDWSSTLVRTHAFGAAGSYAVRLEVRDSNDLTDTAERTVVVDSPPILPDTTPPTVTIASPTGGSVLTSKEVRVTGTASDDRALSLVELSSDGVLWTEAFGTASWSGVIPLGEGTQTIFARAIDVAGNIRETSVTVVIRLSGSTDPDDPPPIDPTRSAGSEGPATLMAILPALLGTAGALVALALAAAYSAERESRGRPAARPPEPRIESFRSRKTVPPPQP